MAATPLQRTIDVLIRCRMPLLYAAIAVTLFAIPPARRLQFNQSIEALYSANNPRLLDYVESKSLFQGDEFVIVAYTDPDLFADAGQQRVERLAGELEKVGGVDPESVQSLSHTLRAIRLPFIARRKDEFLNFCRGILLGEDNQTTAIVVRLIDEQTAPVPRAQTIAEIREIAGEQPTMTHVVGEPVLVHDMFRYAQDDGELMGWASSALLILVILFFLRSIRWVILPILIVQMTIVWTKALLVVSDMQLSMVSSILNSLVTIIGVSTVVYMSFYYRKLRETRDRVPALREMLNVLSVDIFWVCATTATGFAAQLSSHIYPVQSFGLMMVMGSMLVLVAMAFVLPGGILLGKESAAPTPARGEQGLNQSLHTLTDWVLHHSGSVYFACAAVLAASICGLYQLKIETDFSKNFRASAPVVQALEFVETNLGGSGNWEVNFPAPHKLTPEFLDRVRALASRLREIEISGDKPVTKAVAVTDGLDFVPQIRFFIPDLDARLRMLDQVQYGFVPSLYNAEQGRMRIVLRARERTPSDVKEQLIARAQEIAREDFPEAKATGLYVLLTFLIQSLLSDQWVDFGLGAAGIFLMMSIAYRSFWYGFISLIPNVLAMLMLIGSLGWLGIPINIGTAMISSDAMGLTVHDSIFYLSAFLRARREGKDFMGALRETQSEVRRPLVYSNVALVIGFLVLTVSHFTPLIYFGLLVSVAILGGLIGNLILLPLLLRLRGDRPKVHEPLVGTETKSQPRV